MRHGVTSPEIRTTSALSEGLRHELCNVSGIVEGKDAMTKEPGRDIRSLAAGVQEKV